MTDIRQTGVKEAIVNLYETGCPCGVPASDPDRLDLLSRWLLRRFDSAPRRGADRSPDARYRDLIKGLLDDGQPHGGLGPKADVECLAAAAMIALGQPGAASPHGSSYRHA
jgi:hypothetical protein